MKDKTLMEMLKELKNSKDPYECGVVKGIEIALKSFGWQTSEDKEEKNPGAGQSSRGGQK